MNPGQTTLLGAVWPGFIVFALMIEVVLHLKLCSRCNKQAIFSEPTNIWEGKIEYEPQSVKTSLNDSRQI